MEACNLCGGTHWETLEAEGGVRVVRCACEMVFLTPQPSRPSLEEAYGESYYRAWDGQARRRDRIWRRRIERVAALAPPPGQLLDVGCGAGEFLRAARARGWTVAGTELSAYAATAAGDGLRVIPGEVWEADLPAGAFDVVTCWHVIEHVRDPRRAVEEVGRLLRPGGWLILATPNLDDRIFQAAYLLARGRRPRLYAPGEREIHLFCFSARTLRRLVESAGLQATAVGFDRGAAAVWGKQMVNEAAYAWFLCTGLNWGMALELVARKPEGLAGRGRG